jgi:3D (Asp-Asp-Asp) domain-containing protein
MITSIPLNKLSSLPLAVRRALVAAGLLALLAQVGWVTAPRIGGLGPAASQHLRRDLVPSWSLDPGPVEVVRTPVMRLFHMPVTVTGYSSTPDQTDDTPFITAANTPVRPGVLALSRDLLQEFTPGAPFRFGDRVELEGIGVFTVEDTMHPRYQKRADIWFTSRESAQHWGRQRLTLVQLGPLAADGDLMAATLPDRFETALFD